MLIKWGALVVDGRGKLGGHVASKNKGGNYLRTKVTPNNPQTIAQNNVRAIFGSLSSQWSALTESQRESFNSLVDSYAKTNIFGDLKSLTGKALFQKLNQTLVLAGESVLTTCLPPLEIPQTQLDSSGNVFDIGVGSEFALGLVQTTNAVKAILYSSGVVSAGTSFVSNKMKLVGRKDFVSGSTSWDNIDRDYTPIFGTPSVGDKIFFGVRFYNANGQLSPMQTTSLIVTETV